MHVCASHVGIDAHRSTESQSVALRQPAIQIDFVRLPLGYRVGEMPRVKEAVTVMATRPDKHHGGSKAAV
jgi:hypothetical protein